MREQLLTDLINYFRLKFSNNDIEQKRKSLNKFIENGFPTKKMKIGSFRYRKNNR